MHATKSIIRLFCALAVLVSAIPAYALEVKSAHFEETARVANDDLRLNGAALIDGTGAFARSSEASAMGLYLKEYKTTTEAVLAAPGARRVKLVMVQDTDSEVMARGFLQGIRNNLSRTDRIKIASQMQTFGEVFAQVGIFKKGDVFYIDWIPSSATTLITMNGKKLIELPDQAFYNAVLLCFIGERPFGPKLKASMLHQQ
ncbi:chalcone isomerase family protein [Noviherbaspirillum massiliense]|uniref:chalcone isomerase family protein n=1 Tax=Noviherbaspirillum massiliense TaxID=1465823 RepID=UPI000316C3A9|nr:chalcone isomerase family protein [Noviherbaspirillum massiliense]